MCDRKSGVVVRYSVGTSDGLESIFSEADSSVPSGQAWKNTCELVTTVFPYSYRS